MMRTPSSTRTRRLSVASVVLLLCGASGASAQILPWEVIVAQVETGRLRQLSQRLARENLLYHLRLGDVHKTDLTQTVEEVDRILLELENGSPSQSVPAPWTKEIKQQIVNLDGIWGPIRAIALADPYQHLRHTRQFAPRDQRAGDPMLVRYFDALCGEFVVEAEKLMDLYYAECKKTGLEDCETSRAAGRNAMLIEKATKEAIYVAARIDPKGARKRLDEALAAYQKQREANDANPFFAQALDPSRGASAKAAGELLLSLRGDWATMVRQFEILRAGDEENFDVAQMLTVQNALVEKVERLTAQLIRFASVLYGT